MVAMDMEDVVLVETIMVDMDAVEGAEESQAVLHLVLHLIPVHLVLRRRRRLILNQILQKALIHQEVIEEE